ncbi:MAG TPA: GNAT family N-acetyltransferase [Candidatus Bathyarchaeia archaeon]|nr:GNAT family N-acetyltransferase [Candidatus Bathyarchaeia archaeon]
MNSKFISINRVKKQDVLDIAMLQKEFEAYLGRLSGKPREPFSVRKRASRLLRDSFGRKAAFQGFIARKEGKAVGYIFYHQGYDPDEMRGRVIYIVDLFVSENTRRSSVGALLMKRVAALCKKIGGIRIYFGVWLKNKPAIKFYKKLGAEWVTDVPFMRWESEKW